MDPLDQVITWALALVESVDPVTRTLFAGLGIFLETSILVGLIVPGDTIVIVSATAIDSPAEYVALLVAVIVGALGGESVGFLLGRFFGHRLRGSRLGRRIGEPNWHRAENYVDRRGGPAIFLSRFLPLLHSLVPVTVGMSTMRYLTFLAWTTPACVVWALAYVTFGSVAAGGYRQLSSQLHGAGYVFVAILVVAALLVFVVKKLISRSQARHWQRPGDGDATTREDPAD
jgi:membrane-associated protein